MSNLKKAFFGGYKKSEVDAAVNELNKQLEAADLDRKKLQQESRSAEEKIAYLEKQLSDLSSENEKLNAVNERLDTANKNLNAENARLNSERAQGEAIFNDIAKIYRRAYGAGREIVCDSKETAQKLLNDISVRFDEAMGETHGIIEEYETVHRDINDLFASLSRDISDVAQTASQMLDRAKMFAGIYGQLKSAVNSAQENTQRLFAEYDMQASEFLNASVPSESPDRSAAHTFTPAETSWAEPGMQATAQSAVIPDASEEVLYDKTDYYSIDDNSPAAPVAEGIAQAPEAA
ncbi:MAG: hypothetical protein PUC05_02930, partial [Firmicutes bacterium]|nr:hypothetical protein [Bacillota bacterium]